MDEIRRRADEVQDDCVHGESQQLDEAQERVRGLQEELASTVEELHRETTQVDWLRGFLFQKASELNKRKEEQISNSRDRKNGKKSWKKGNVNTIWN